MNYSVISKYCYGMVAFTFLFLIACEEEEKSIPLPETDLATVGMIPKPAQVVATKSAFLLDENTGIFTGGSDQKLQNVGQELKSFLRETTTLDLNINTEGDNSSSPKRFIYIDLAENLEEDNPEGYELYIKQDSIVLSATTAEGAFRGVQTLKQIIPIDEIQTDSTSQKKHLFVPTGKIIDAPQYAFRGAMLDVARHFFSVQEVKRYIDQLAYYKYNKLHLHLSDDQGWRIHINAYPLLTEKGGRTEVGGGASSYFSQEDFREIVRYAQEKYIEIIPEIDMPGHTNAASFAYPILNGNGKPIINYTGTNVGFSTFDAKRDTVYQFIDKVMEELAAISPSPYFHVGGDESHVTKKKDYIHFVARVEEIVRKHGKTMIGWEEIAQAQIDKRSIVQFWNDSTRAKEAVKKGHQLIFSPAHRMYLDMKYDSTSTYGLQWAGYIPLKKAYNWSPETYVSGIDKTHILGIEAPLWSETIFDSASLEYLAFPRALAYAELGWTASNNREWNDFKRRLALQTPYFDREKIAYYPAPDVEWPGREE